jgi:hypothetical protein
MFVGLCLSFFKLRYSWPFAVVVETKVCMPEVAGSKELIGCFKLFLFKLKIILITTNHNFVSHFYSFFGSFVRRMSTEEDIEEENNLIWDMKMNKLHKYDKLVLEEFDNIEFLSRSIDAVNIQLSYLEEHSVGENLKHFLYYRFVYLHFCIEEAEFFVTGVIKDSGKRLSELQQRYINKLITGSFYEQFRLANVNKRLPEIHLCDLSVHGHEIKCMQHLKELKSADCVSTFSRGRIHEMILNLENKMRSVSISVNALINKCKRLLKANTFWGLTMNCDSSVLIAHVKINEKYQISEDVKYQSNLIWPDCYISRRQDIKTQLLTVTIPDPDNFPNFNNNLLTKMYADLAAKKADDDAALLQFKTMQESNRLLKSLKKQKRKEAVESSVESSKSSTIDIEKREEQSQEWYVIPALIEEMNENYGIVEDGHEIGHKIGHKIKHEIWHKENTSHKTEIRNEKIGVDSSVKICL